MSQVLRTRSGPRGVHGARFARPANDAKPSEAEHSRAPRHARRSEARLARDLPRLDRRISGRVLLVGVGCAGRGDDAAGPTLARRLRDRFPAVAIDGGDRPEDVTGEIAQAQADTILIADAADLGARAGEVAVLDAGEIRDRGLDTHRASLATLMRYLELRTGARVLLLAIQPAQLGDTGELSAPVAATVLRLGEMFEAEAVDAEDPGHALQGGEPWTSSSGS
jgi:hydrogenase 3 maturation protease